MSKPFKHPHPPRIAVCIDPFNLKSADLMIEHIKEAGCNVIVFQDYSRMVARMRNSRPIDFRLIDGVIIMGNDKYEVTPETYVNRYAKGAPEHGYVHPETHSESSGDPQARDRAIFERYMIHEALARKIPLLGICGGMQRINVECGEEAEPGHGKGTLLQYLPDYVGDQRHNQELCGKDPHEAAQKITVEAGTKLAGIIRTKENEDLLSVNSDSAPEASLFVSTRHKQAVERLGEGLRIAARHVDNHPVSGKRVEVIKAIEASPGGRYGDQFVMGLQFHPEYVRNHHFCETLVRRFTKEARKYATRHPQENQHMRAAEKNHRLSILGRNEHSADRFAGR